MNTMSMPGFTAESSLYRTDRERHKFSAPASEHSTEQRVTPQFQLCSIIYCIGFRCVYDCEEAPM